MVVMVTAHLLHVGAETLQSVVLVRFRLSHIRARLGDDQGWGMSHHPTATAAIAARTNRRTARPANAAEPIAHALYMILTTCSHS